MGIQTTTPAGEISEYIDTQVQRIKEAALREMFVAGEKVLTAMRSTNSYKDQTGNLRSSIGYAVIQDGEIMTISDFQAVKDGNEGSETGAAYIQELAANFPEGIVLICCAGMTYATYVQARGLDVITSGELLAERLIPQILQRLNIE